MWEKEKTSLCLFCWGQRNWGLFVLLLIWMEMAAKMGSQVIVPYRGVDEEVRHLKLMGDLGQVLWSLVLFLFVYNSETEVWTLLLANFIDNCEVFFIRKLWSVLVVFLSIWSLICFLFFHMEWNWIWKCCVLMGVSSLLFGMGGQIVPMRYDVRDEGSIRTTIASSNIIVNCIGKKSS